MNCPTSATVSSSQTQVPSFLDTNTGENSCSGCTTSSSGDTVCGHATSFSYSIATYSTATSDWWYRIYANYVLYILFVIDAYFVAVFIVGFIMKRKKKQMRVMDTTNIAANQLELKDPKVEQASSFDKNSVHSTHSKLKYLNIIRYRMDIYLKHQHDIFCISLLYNVLNLFYSILHLYF